MKNQQQQKQSVPEEREEEVIIEIPPLLAGCLLPKLDNDNNNNEEEKKEDDDEGASMMTMMDLVLRENLIADNNNNNGNTFQDLIESLKQLGKVLHQRRSSSSSSDHRTTTSRFNKGGEGSSRSSRLGLTGIFLYKDFASKLSHSEQVVFYQTLGESLGGGGAGGGASCCCTCPIEELSISFVQLPVSSLATLLQQLGANLKKIHLGRVTLLGSTNNPEAQNDDAATELYQALDSKYLPNLEEFHCSLAPPPTTTTLSSNTMTTLFQPRHNNDNNDNNEDDDSSSTLDELLLSLANKIPTLQTLYIAAPFTSSPHARGEEQQQHSIIRRSECLRALSSSRSIMDLTLMNCPLATTTAEQVRSLLYFGNRSFTSLALINTQIGDEGAKIIVEQCCSSNQQQQQQQQQNNMEEEVASGSGSGLQKLYLPGNQITDVGGNAIARALRRRRRRTQQGQEEKEEEPAPPPPPLQQLQVLDLHDNQLTSEFGICMGLSLQQQQQQQQQSVGLRFLDVSFNPLKDAGGIALARGLTNNTTLEQLNLFQNQISNQTCIALANALGGNGNGNGSGNRRGSSRCHQLKRLNLYHNPLIDQRGVDSLLHNLEHKNYILEGLEISLNFDTSTTRTTTNDDGINTTRQQQQRRNVGAEIDFWLTLNRKFERRNMLNVETTDLDFVTKGLGQTTNDLKSLFYFLKSKPTLCQQQQHQQDQPSHSPQALPPPSTNTNTNTITNKKKICRSKISRSVSLVTEEACNIIVGDDDF